MIQSAFLVLLLSMHQVTNAWSAVQKYLTARSAISRNASTAWEILAFQPRKRNANVALVSSYRMILALLLQLLASYVRQTALNATVYLTV